MKYKIDEEIRANLRQLFVRMSNHLLERLDSDEPLPSMNAFNKIDAITDIMSHLNKWSKASMNTGIIASNMDDAEMRGWTIEDARHRMLDEVESEDCEECSSNKKEYLK